ncbi:hypothetical protein [Methyloligella solikamskensis]|uniref:EamA domain-containing protein n=1 Tax=Methyloligella solikamskensis TaxID=1177756 RepID=A0ABW3JDI4_9HYPH
MLIAAIVIIVLAIALIGYLLWKSPRRLSAADFAFALSPVLIGVLIVVRWPHDPLAVGLGLILVLIGVYSANRLHTGH